MKTIRTVLGLIALLFLTGVSVQAQTTLDSTTLSAAITSTSATSITLASTSDLAIGEVLFVDREAMLVRTVSPTTVTRGHANTRPATHGNGALVYVEVAGAYYSNAPAIGSSCERTEERYLPHVVLPSGEVWDCPTSSDAWVYLNDPAALTIHCDVGPLATANVDQTCFIADRNYVVTKIQEIHTTAESAGALTLIPRRQQGTEAAASGDALATAIDMVGAGAVAQTLKTATLTTTTANLLINAGDRLGLDFTDDVAGELAGVVVTFQLSPR